MSYFYINQKFISFYINYIFLENLIKFLLYLLNFFYCNHVLNILVYIDFFFFYIRKIVEILNIK